MGTPLISPEFTEQLGAHGLTLTRGATRTLQVNVGYRCDLVCRHCHLSAGPHRSEMMTKATMDDVIAYARRGDFRLADVTGGAPELIPGLDHLLTGLAEAVPQVMLRTNLTALHGEQRSHLLEVCRQLRIVLVASFPAITSSQLESQRGKGVWEGSVAMLRELNAIGYGRPESGLELHLVANPAGAFLPQGQAVAERQFKRLLAERLGISFNRLFIFANAPLGRFLAWLEQSGNAATYLDKLMSAFNPGAVEGLMCRSLVSVAWDGILYDCDFNQAAALPLGGRRRHIREMRGAPEAGSTIATGRHCFACTAGAGFT
jgi:radical SAM/Cys-rich protein